MDDNGKQLDLTAFLQIQLQQLGITAPVHLFLHYLTLLTHWNRTYNLTAIRDIESMISYHLLDSLAIIPWLKGTRLLDVGSGAGLPGIPLAIALPHYHVVLLDSNGKKIRFLQAVQRTLALSNISIVQARVENYVDPQGFDIVISRAFSNLKKMISYTQHLLALQGRWLALKGQYPENELASIANPYQVEKYCVAGVEGQRCCVIIER